MAISPTRRDEQQRTRVGTASCGAWPASNGQSRCRESESAGDRARRGEESRPEGRCEVRFCGTLTVNEGMLLTGRPATAAMPLPDAARPRTADVRLSVPLEPAEHPLYAPARQRDAR